MSLKLPLRNKDKIFLKIKIFPDRPIIKTLTTNNEKYTL